MIHGDRLVVAQARQRWWAEVRHRHRDDVGARVVPRRRTGHDRDAVAGGDDERPRRRGPAAAAPAAPAVELAPLRVDAGWPGVVRTPLWTGGDEEQMFADIAKTLPVGRVGGPRGVADAYVHLMTSAYATGSALTVDGGYVLV